MVERDPCRDACSPVAPLRQIAWVAENLPHQDVEQTSRGPWPGCAGRTTREAKTRQRRHHDIERILGYTAMAARKRERFHDRPILVERTGPAMGQEQGAAAFRLTYDMNKMEIASVSRGDCLREAVEFPGSRDFVVSIDPVAAKVAEKIEIAAVAPPPCG